MWDPLKKCMFGQILELCSYDSKLKNLSYITCVLSYENITQDAKIWDFSDENWEEHQVMGFEFQWKYCYYGALVSSTTMYCYIKSKWDRWLCYFSLFHFFFLLDTLFFTLIGVLASHTHNLFHFTVPSSLSLSSHFSSYEKSGASEVEKLSSRRHELTEETHVARHWTVLTQHNKWVPLFKQNFEL